MNIYKSDTESREVETTGLEEMPRPSTQDMIDDYEKKIIDLEEQTKSHRKLCSCGKCELLGVYFRMASKYRLIQSWEAYSNIALFMEIDGKITWLTDWAGESADLSEDRKAKISFLGDLWDVFRLKIHTDNLDADPDPCTFNHQDLEDLTISLVDGILAGISKEEPLPDPSYSKEHFYNALRRAIHYRTEQTLKDYFGSELEKNEAGCLHDYELSPGCGVDVCTKCGDHKGLARCYCGWNLEPGERLEDDVDY